MSERKWEISKRATKLVAQLELIASHAETAPDISPNGKNHRYISAVGLADVLLEAAELIDEYVTKTLDPRPWH